MTWNRTKKLVPALAISALVLGGCATPYQSQIISDSEITVAWNDLMDEFNDLTVTGNYVSNGLVAYLTRSNFSYYDDSPELVMQKEFGSYKKTSDEPLTVNYEINDGVVWSDGVPIDEADLLLAWVSTFGFGKEGDGADAVFPFQHANPRPELASKLPTLGDRSITFEYDKPFVDWELTFGVGMAAHGTVMLAYPELTPEEAKAKFIEAVQSNDQAWLAAVGEAWSTGYQYVNTPSNPLVTLSSGPYIVEELVEDNYVTLVANPLYSWGPSPKYERVTIREIGDPTAAVQAVENGEVQIASGQPTADVLQLVQALPNADYVTGVGGAYEHIDLTVNNGGPFDPASYGGDAEKAQKVRQAFLLTIPRQQIIDTIIKPLNPDAEIRQSILIAPGFPGYDKMVADNGSDFYATDIDKAKALLAEAGVSTPVKVGFWYPEGNVRRAQQFELIAASAALAGFEVEDQSEPNWEFTGLAINPHDAVIFAWAATSLAVTGSDQYLSAGQPSNWTGYDNPEVTRLLQDLEVELDEGRQIDIQIEVEKLLWSDGYGTTIFQHPELTWFDSGVDGVSSNPLVPYYFWNFWDWKPVAG
jgi:peptide/nickel transport system substrate-binding protein